MSKYKMKAWQARQAEEIRIASLVPCELCATPSAPTGTYVDSQGFNRDAAICELCEFGEERLLEVE